MNEIAVDNDFQAQKAKENEVEDKAISCTLVISPLLGFLCCRGTSLS